MESSGLDLAALLMGLLGGLALFLFGMEQLASALKAVAGDGMKAALARLTRTRFSAVATGALVTAVIQSSSITTVLVVGFISAGLMSMTQSIGVIMGANIGTTITAQIIAFQVARYALALIAVGFVMQFFAERAEFRQYGKIIMGLGLVFFGMGIMGDGMAPLRSQEFFLDWMARMENPLIGILLGMLFTALVQSSSATTGVVIAMASQGLLSLPAGIALILGSNIGTCITAILAAIGRPREAQRASLVHLTFNVLGVLIWFLFIPQLAQLATWISPHIENVTGIAQRAAETPRQIANAHTIFNVTSTVLFIGFATQFARLVEWLVPDRPLAEEDELRARYLAEDLISTPSLALDLARREILNVGSRVKRMMREILPAMLTGNGVQLDEVERMDEAVDALHGHIITYLGRISQNQLSEGQTDELIRLMEAANDLENIGDIIETNLTALGRRRIEHGVRISEPTQQVIRNFHESVSEALDSALHAITEKDEDVAKRVIAMKPAINQLAESASAHEATRLVIPLPNRLHSYAVETDMLENLKRVYYFCKRMARASIPAHARAEEPE